MGVKVLVTGSRHWTDREAVLRALVMAEVTSVVEGCAKGADAAAEWAADLLELPIHHHPADWQTHGRAAGPKRNQEMLDKHPDIGVVLAFPLKGSIGTWDMVRRAQKAMIRVIIKDGV